MLTRVPLGCAMTLEQQGMHPQVIQAERDQITWQSRIVPGNFSQNSSVQAPVWCNGSVYYLLPMHSTPGSLHEWADDNNIHNNICAQKMIYRLNIELPEECAYMPLQYQAVYSFISLSAEIFIGVVLRIASSYHQ